MKRVAKWAIVPLFLIFAILMIGIEVTKHPSMPDIQLTDLQGNPFRTSDFGDHPWYLEFWSVDCSTCLQDFPKLMELQTRTGGKDVQVVAVAIQQDDIERVKVLGRPLEEKGIRVVYDHEGAIARQLEHPPLTPYGLLIKDGLIRKIFIGKLSVENVVDAIR